MTDLIGMGVNGVTGDYSRGAAGFWIEDGAIAYPVSEITIAGNLKTMFRELIPADDLEIRGAVNAPSLLVPEMTLPAPDALGDIDLVAERHIIETAVREAGELALAHFRSGTKGWAKADGTPVSDVDLAVDRLLAERLRAARPGYGWLSEETVDDRERLNRRFVFIVDPIDGTRAYLAGTEHWCVAVALVTAGRPVAAAVFQPTEGKLFSATLGMGAELNGQAVQVTRRSTLEGSHLIAHQSLNRPGRWTTPWPPVRLGMTFAMLLRLCLVAEGRFDGMVALGPKSDWDVAAGDLIVHEAGGRATDLRGDTIIYNREVPVQAGLIAGGPLIMPEMIDFARGYREW